MGWRFRKRINIAPGVNINLSKSGVSTTIGKKGASVNIGKNGTYLNTGLPGTGLYNRTKLKSDSINSMSNRTKGTHYPVFENYKKLYPKNNTSNGDGDFHGFFYLISIIIEIALPIYIAYCILRHHTINYTIVAISALCFFSACLYFYKERNEFKNIEDVTHWLSPIEGVLLFWLFCSFGLTIIHILLWIGRDYAFNFYDLINVIVFFFLFGYVSEKRRKEESFLKSMTDYRIKKANIETYTILANESDEDKRIFYYGEILFNGGEIEKSPIPLVKRFPNNAKENKDNATLIIDLDIYGIGGFFKKIEKPLIDDVFKCCWELLSYSKNYKGYYYNKNIQRERNYIGFDNCIFNHVASSEGVISFGSSNYANFIYPLFWVMAKDSTNFEITSIDDVYMNIQEVYYIETDEKLRIHEEKQDFAIISSKQYPVYKYALVTVTSANDTINYSLIFTNYVSAEKWVDSFNNYVKRFENWKSRGNSFNHFRN